MRLLLKERSITLNDQDINSLEFQKKNFDDVFACEEDFIERDELLTHDMKPIVRSLVKRSSCVQQRSAKWFKQRSRKLTGSAVAACIGASKYKSRSDLMLDKLGLGEKFRGNACTYRGQQLEPWAAKAYELKSGRKLIPFDLGLMDHLEHDEIAGSCDGITYCGRLIEIKCPLRRRITGKVPGHYLPQIQILLEIHDVEWCDFIDYCPGVLNVRAEVCRITPVRRDRAWFTRHFPAMKRFVKEMRYRMDNTAKIMHLDLGYTRPRSPRREPEPHFKFVGEPDEDPKDPRYVAPPPIVVEPAVFSFI